MEDGNESDDKVAVKSQALFPVSELRPSQTSMNIQKAMGFVISMIRGKMSLGGDLGAFISSDKFIMDGHHRWISTAMVDPTKPVGGFLVDMPGADLVKVLNAMTVGRFGELEGKPASGGFEQFEEASVRETLTKFAKEGIDGKFPVESAVVLSALEEWTGQQGDEAIKSAGDKIVSNLSALTLSVPPWAPARPDMPVIDEPNVPSAVSALSQGEIDWNDPTAQGERDA